MSARKILKILQADPHRWWSVVDLQRTAELTPGQTILLMMELDRRGKLETCWIEQNSNRPPLRGHRLKRVLN